MIAAEATPIATVRSREASGRQSPSRQSSAARARLWVQKASDAASAAPAAGYAIVPSEQAQTLVAYLLNLNTVYDYPESRPVVQAAAQAEGAHK